MEKKLAALFLFCLAGCAKPGLFIFGKSEYQYHVGGNRYRLVLKNGRIDSSFVSSKNDSVVEVSTWVKNGDLSIQTIHPIVSASNGEACDTNGYERDTEYYSSEFKKLTRKMVAIYNAHLKIRPRFKGKMTFKFVIDPKGTFERIYLIRNTTGNHEFTLDIIKLISESKFKSSTTPCNDVISVPFTFSE